MTVRPAEPAAIRRLVEDVLQVTVVTAEPAPRGGANENWFVNTSEGVVVLKIATGMLAEDKLVAASRALSRARAAGVPTPRELAVVQGHPGLDGRLARVYAAVPGRHLDELDLSPAVTQRFFASLGDCVALMHSVRCAGFASRVDGTPSFATWADYLEWRLPQIHDRALAADTLTNDELARVEREVIALAERVSPLVTPVLTHRDLHLDNVLVKDDGSVAAILDFDGAEPWDAAVDFVKLTADTFPRHRGSASVFHAAYARRAGSLPENLPERLRLAELVEVTNFIANRARGAEPGGPFRARLAKALADDG